MISPHATILSFHNPNGIVAIKTSCARGALAGALLFSSPAQAQYAVQVVPNELKERIANHYIVVFDDSVSSAGVEARSKDITAFAAGERTRVFKTALHGFSVRMAPDRAERLQARFPEIA